MQASFNKYSLVQFNDPTLGTISCYLHPLLQGSTETAPPSAASTSSRHQKSHGKSLLNAAKKASESLQTFTSSSYKWLRDQHLLSRAKAVGQSLRGGKNKPSSPTDFINFNHHRYQVYKPNRTAKRLAWTSGLALLGASQALALVHTFNNDRQEPVAADAQQELCRGC